MSTRPHMCRLATALALLVTSSAALAAAENCLFQISPAEAPYQVLGTPVTPQSNYLVVADCTKTISEVHADLVTISRERARAMAEAEERAKRARAEGDELIRMRDRAQEVDAETKGSLGSWFGWF